MGFADVVTFLNERLFRWTYTPLIYPLMLFVGLLIRLMIPSHTIDDLRNIFSKHSFFDDVFANHAFEVFTILWLFIFFVRVLKDFTRSKYQTLLPTSTNHQSDSKSRTAKAWNLLVVFLFKYCLTLIFVGILLKFREYVHNSQEMNISGHYIGIVTLSLTILWEVKNSISDAEILELDAPDGIDKRTMLTYSLLSGVLCLCALISVIWWVELLITAIFYHTVIEKFLGLCLGFVSPTVVYIRITSLA
jgi:hypothetical protein